jgi:hypothetical protein
MDEVVAVAAQKFQNFSQQFVELHVDQNYIFYNLKNSAEFNKFCKIWPKSWKQK